jgi:ubiquitin conjugation factor E4 B
MDVRQVSTHGFMFNLTHVCLSLCDPILDFKFSKLLLINDNYLDQFDRFDVTEETRINTDKSTLEEYIKNIKNSNGNAPNFVSDIFFITIASHHFGVMSIIRHFHNMNKQIEKMVEQLEKLKKDQLNGQWEGPMQNIYMNHFQKFQVD